MSQTLKSLEEVEQNKIDLETRVLELNSNMSKTEERLQKSSSLQNEELENLKRDKELFNMETEILKKSAEDACKERDSIIMELNTVRDQNQKLLTDIEDMSKSISKLQQDAQTIQKNSNDEISKLVNKSLENSAQILKTAIHEIDNPALTALTCTPDYLRSLAKSCLDSFNFDEIVLYTDNSKIIITASDIAHKLAVFILQGRATGNKSPDINFGESEYFRFCGVRLYSHLIPIALYIIASNK